VFKDKLIRVTTVPLSLEKLLEGQLSFMKQYYEVTAISAEKEKLFDFGKSEDIETYFIPLTRKITPLKDLWAVLKLYSFFKRKRPLIVHSHTPKAGICSMMAAYFAKVPLRIHTVAGLPLMEATGLKRRVLNFVEKRTYKYATHVYPNSKGLYDFIVAEGFTKKSKLRIIGNGSSNGIDTSYFSKGHFTVEELIQKRNSLGISPSDFVYVFVGRIVTDKGINELVEAFIKLQQKHKYCSLLLVGPFEDSLDPVSENTRKCISQNSKIISTGYQEDVRVYYALSNVLVFPSYREGFPNVVLQAGAMKLPSIVTDINGCNEIIVHNKNGLLIPSKDSIALYNAMELIYEDPILSQKLKDNSRRMIADRYLRQHLWKEILDEYKTLQKNL